jgi:uncharacterized protein
MSKHRLIGTALLVVASLVAMPSLAQDPSLHDVYQAAEAGNYAQAQRMMDQVLRDHPNSAKAHYVEAELLARQGKLAAASVQLDFAERLDPGLRFAKPEAVRDLKSRIASPRNTFPVAMPGTTTAAAGNGAPWGMLLLGAGVLALIVLGVRATNRHNGAPAPVRGFSAYGANPPMPPPGVGAPGGYAPAAGGMGSGILGGLASGAALGAGMVAGEVLARRFMGDRQGGGAPLPFAGDVQHQVPDDLGGTNFGVTDTSYWDDDPGIGGAESGGDWS